MNFAVQIVSLFAAGALAGLLAEWLSRRFSGAPAAAPRRLGAALALGALAAGYWYFLERAGDPPLAGYAVRMAAAFVMLTVSLTDFDLLMIPDAVMIPATTAAVAAMTAFDAAFPVDWITEDGFLTQTMPMTALPPWLMPGAGTMLAVSIAGWLFWCFALLDRRFYPKLGIRRAGYLFFRRLGLSRLTWILAALALGGCAAAILVACRWPACLPRLFSSVVGAAAAMVLIWAVRLVGRALLGREAMGFGDVVLMGFIGAVVGWQGAVAVFFLAPFAGIVFALARAAIRTEREIPYGPFLCLAAAAVYFLWGPIWRAAAELFCAPAVVLILAAVCLAALVVLLGLIRLIRALF
ncbi:MAG: prepilin peptidase [Thermoguttaceae bacterium]|nr:prepilin peptidase [Thermoguttaceae bacterium]